MLAQNLNYGLVKNKASNFIQPCVATITAGTQGIVYPPDLRVSLTDGPDPHAYPITGTTYALVYQNQTDAAKAKALVNFFSWTLSTGQDDAASVNYAPLGKDFAGFGHGRRWSKRSPSTAARSESESGLLPKGKLRRRKSWPPPTCRSHHRTAGLSMGCSRD